MLRKSGIALNLSDVTGNSSLVAKLYSLHDTYQDMIQRLTPFIKMQMELLDQIETESANSSHLYKIIVQIQGIDSHFVRSMLIKVGVNCVMDEIVKLGDIEIKDGMIIS